MGPLRPPDRRDTAAKPSRISPWCNSGVDAPPGAYESVLILQTHPTVGDGAHGARKDECAHWTRTGRRSRNLRDSGSVSRQ